MRTCTLLFLPALAVTTGLAAAADWPQWRGPKRDGHSADTGLLPKWPEGGPKLVATFKDAGAGYSSPAVVGDRLYLAGADEQNDLLYALDVRTLKQLWSTPIGPRYKQNRGDGPRGTPTADGAFVYALGGQGTLVCVKADDGAKVWEKSLPRDLGGRMMSGWGYSESPLIDGDQVVCTPGGGNGAVAALDKKTGEVLWRSKEFTDPAGYSSLVAADIGGVRQYVQMTGQSVAGIAAKDGKLLWKTAKQNPTAAVPTPIVSGNLVYATSGYGAGCALYKIEGSGDTQKATEVYANKNMTNHHGGVVLVGGHVYGYSDRGGWVCQDFMTGEIVWQNRGIGKGSVTYADGHLYCYAEGDGSVALVEATPRGYVEKGRFKIPQRTSKPFPSGQRGGNNVWAHPVVANGRLYLRDQELLFVYDVRGGQ